ncbi:MAG: membrane protein insertase YidC, partial [Gammaproteobacteria bacterium]
MNRLFLYSGFLFILILIFDAYDRDYNQPQVSSTNIIENSATNDSKQPPQTDTIKRDSSDKSTPITKNIDVLESNKLIIEFDINTGELLYSELKDYSVDLGSDEQIIILDYPNKKYSATSNVQLLGFNSYPTYDKKSTSGKNAVVLESNNIRGVTLIKEITLLDDTHQVTVTNRIKNNSSENIEVRNYETIS